MPAGNNMKTSAVTAYQNGGKAHSGRKPGGVWNTTGTLKPREAERIALVVKFADLYQRFGHNPRAMYYLARWADRNNLTLGRHAREAARGWKPCVNCPVWKAKKRAVTA